MVTQTSNPLEQSDLPRYCCYHTSPLAIFCATDGTAEQLLAEDFAPPSLKSHRILPTSPLPGVGALQGETASDRSPKAAQPRHPVLQVEGRPAAELSNRPASKYHSHSIISVSDVHLATLLEGSALSKHEGEAPACKPIRVSVPSWVSPAETTTPGGSPSGCTGL
ncbi:hypothetical protein N656DRAFT_784754 [Canariomyces notabilis]|uniref:Uncharacterized protein n=1 Tax=Canariomyces notabilis TaxID=2074819 RepID=A0AAN6T7F9_9PEZI|nr:hypothetical protein N656DRAFT_784754 [Canariomyces arenarius]